MRFPNFKFKTIRISAANMTLMEKRLKRMKREERILAKTNPIAAERLRMEIELTEASLMHLEESGISEPRLRPAASLKVVNRPESVPDWVTAAMYRGYSVKRR